MKNKKLISNILIILIFCCALGFAFNYRNAKASDKVTLKIKSSSTNYQLGVMIPIEAKITNNSSEPIYFSEELFEPVEIQIAFKENANYKTYVGRGRLYSLDGEYPLIKVNPNETIVRQTTILWNKNLKPEVANLSPEASKSYIEGKILTDYAFPEAGTYFIKFVLRDIVLSASKDGKSTVITKGKKSIIIESEPIQVTIEAPIGEDLMVWNRIKGKGEIAYFIQEGEFVDFKNPEERAKFQQEIEQIINQYPNSLIVNQMVQSLEKFKASEAKRNELTQQIQTKKEKP